MVLVEGDLVIRAAGVIRVRHLGEALARSGLEVIEVYEVATVIHQAAVGATLCPTMHNCRRGDNFRSWSTSSSGPWVVGRRRGARSRTRPSFIGHDRCGSRSVFNTNR